MTVIELEPLSSDVPTVRRRRRPRWSPLAWSYRMQCALGLAVCAALLGYALYVEHQMFMMPCPLCILQRLAVAGMGVGFFLGVVLGRRSWTWARRATASLVALMAAAGAGVAGWHVRLQYSPPSDLPSCGSMDLSYMLDAFPLHTVVRKVFEGSGECAKIDWSFLGLSMPVWTLACFVVMGVGVVWAGFRKRR